MKLYKVTARPFAQSSITAGFDINAHDSKEAKEIFERLYPGSIIIEIKEQ